MKPDDMIISYFRLSELERIERIMPTGAKQLLKSGCIAPGYSHIAILNDDGTVTAYGNNQYGQCDTAKWKDVVKVAAGDYHTVALKKDGTVIAAGDNSCGQCEVSDWRDVQDVFAEKGMTFGFRFDGKMLFTGYSELREDVEEPADEILADDLPASEKDFIYSEPYGSIMIIEYTGKNNVVVVPEMINGKKVTRIGRLIFGGRPDIKGVTFPASMEYMGDGVCEDFRLLERAVVKGGMVSSCAFRGCVNLKEVVIKDGVVSIWSKAFKDCPSLKVITIPKSVTQMGNFIFDKGVTIRCYRDSYANQYAIKRKMDYEIIE